LQGIRIPARSDPIDWVIQVKTGLLYTIVYHFFDISLQMDKIDAPLSAWCQQLRAYADYVVTSRRQ
jgi:hypothetical protein